MGEQANSFRSFVRRRWGWLALYVAVIYLLFVLALINGVTWTMTTFLGSAMILTAPASALFFIIGSMFPAGLRLSSSVGLASIGYASALLLLPIANIVLVYWLTSPYRRRREEKESTASPP